MENDTNENYNHAKSMLLPLLEKTYYFVERSIKTILTLNRDYEYLKNTKYLDYPKRSVEMENIITETRKYLDVHSLRECLKYLKNI